MCVKWGVRSAGLRNRSVYDPQPDLGNASVGEYLCENYSPAGSSRRVFSVLELIQRRK